MRGINMQLQRAEVTALVGPNGAGKSSLAKLVLGIHKADEGEVQRAPNLCCGYAPQILQPDWTMPMNALRFMRLNARISKARAQRALTEAGLGALAGAQLRELSGGEFQRLLFARAIVRRPQLLVLDEPAQGLDAQAARAMYERIPQCCERFGCAVLLVSHDLKLACAVSGRVLALEEGRLCA